MNTPNVPREPQMLILGPTGGPGRPPMYGTPATSSFQFRMTTEQRQDLNQIAQSEGRDLAAVVRDAVDEYVADFRERQVFKKPGKYRPE